jgi:phytoene dehydrogenase-like protein
MANEYDVIVIGGGINGLTTACYLQKSGLRVAVFEARGQCGANCDTVELGMPGFLHNTHATWLVPAMSPAMADLELADQGLELCGTDTLFAVPHRDGTNTVQSLDPLQTMASVARHSGADAERIARFLEFGAAHMAEAMELNGLMQFARPTMAIARRMAAFNGEMAAFLGLPVDADDILRMTGFELLDLVFESEKVRVLPASMGEFTGQWPVHRRVAPTVLGLCGMMPIAVHQARGGSHELTHALVRCLLAHGGRIWTTCPVRSIVTENGRACGIRLAPEALFPDEVIRARAIVSNLGFTPTFRDLLGEAVIGPEWMQRVRYFSYDDPQLMGFHYALKDAPVFRSAAFDPAIQRCWVGYFGCDDMRDIQDAQTRVLGGEIPPATMGGWFIPTLADPGQAPPGCHTVYAWQTVPPKPRRGRGRRLNGWDAWREGLGEALLGEMTAVFEEMAPGFRDLIVEQHINTPRHQEQGNPTNVRGNMIGGSAIPEQAGENRPLPGVCVGGAARTFVPGLYLSNSIHPFGATHLASGCIAANEVAEDFGAREQPWWNGKPLEWFFANMGSIPLNRGVDARWLPPAGGTSQ